MATTSPAQGFPLPEVGDDPNVAEDMANLGLAIEKRVVGVYLDSTDRDAKTSAAGVQEGMVAFLKDSSTLHYYDGTAWQQMFPADLPNFSSGASVPSNAVGEDGDVFFKI